VQSNAAAVVVVTATADDAVVAIQNRRVWRLLWWLSGDVVCHLSWSARTNKSQMDAHAEIEVAAATEMQWL